MTPSPRNNIASLQYLRAIAAVCVLLMHASHYLFDARGDATFSDIFDTKFGKIGVYLFFAISGFLMAELAGRARPGLFLVHRMIRIYPIFWILALVWLLISGILGNPVFVDPLSLSLIPSGRRMYPLGVEWTLPFELTYYLFVFAVVLLGWRRFLSAMAAIWIVSIGVYQLVLPDLNNTQFPSLSVLPFSQHNVAFALGLLIPSAVRRFDLRFIAPMVALALLVTGELSEALGPRLWCYAIGSAAMVVWAVAANETSKPPIRLAVALGDWSFALYLIHVPVILMVYRFAPANASSWAMWSAAIGGSIFGTVVVGKLDIRLYRFLKSWSDNASLRTINILCVLFVGMFIFAASKNWFHQRREAKLLAEIQQLSESGAGGGNDLNQALARMGMKSDAASYGTLEVGKVTGDKLTLLGWAVGSSSPRREPVVVITYNNEVSAAIIPDVYRWDLFYFFIRQRPWIPAAFYRQITVAPCKTGDTVAAVAIYRQTATFKNLGSSTAC